LLSGVIVPLVTPLLDRDHLDLAGLGRLIEHVIAGGVNGLLVLGTNGELAAVSPRLRRELIARVGRVVRGRVPFVVGVSDPAVTETLALASHAMVAGAAAVVLAPPHYLPPAQDELLAYVTTVAREQPLPVLLYNIPAIAKVAFEADTVRRLADVEKVIGIKDSSGELELLRGVARTTSARRDWSLLVGAEHLFTPAMEAGLQGCVGGGANVAPRLFADLYTALRARDAARIAPLDDRLHRLVQIYRIAGSGLPATIRGIKTALHLLGICPDRMTDPFRPATPSERDEVRAILAELDVFPPPVGAASAGAG
jgi:4-hydroxy-tetrahydrodipicolinate synthase